MSHEIVVGVEGTQSSRRAVHRAAEAAWARRAELLLVHAVGKPVPGHEDRALRVAPLHVLRGCFGCDNCYGVCPDDAVKLGAEGEYEIDLDSCKGCGICATECPAGAILMVPEDR